MKSTQSLYDALLLRETIIDWTPYAANLILERALFKMTVCCGCQVRPEWD